MFAGATSYEGFVPKMFYSHCWHVCSFPMGHSTVLLEHPQTWQLSTPTVNSPETKAEDVSPFIA